MSQAVAVAARQGGLVTAVYLGCPVSSAPGVRSTARINHADRTGRIADGLRADLVLLDRDPFAGPPEEIQQARVAATFVDGHEVFRA
jgi:hypothetical protein